MLGVPRMGQSLFMDMHEREEKRVAMGLVAEVAAQVLDALVAPVWLDALRLMPRNSTN
jgi:hypothetical protein